MMLPQVSDNKQTPADSPETTPARVKYILPTLNFAIMDCMELCSLLLMDEVICILPSGAFLILESVYRGIFSLEEYKGIQKNTDWPWIEPIIIANLHVMASYERATFGCRLHTNLIPLSVIVDFDCKKTVPINAVCHVLTCCCAAAHLRFFLCEQIHFATLCSALLVHKEDFPTKYPLC
ncbi:uncharacterized protein V6R79_019841 [Siganus canaliculatus]